MDAKELVQKQRDFFMTGKTKSLAFRKAALEHLHDVIQANEDKLLAALQLDLGKAEQEAYMTELSLVYEEIKYVSSHLEKWASPKKVRPSLAQLPATCQTRMEPYGVVLIMAQFPAANAPINGSMESKNG